MGILLTVTEAQASAAGGSVGMGIMIVVYLVVIGFFYFAMRRPQKQEEKRIASMLANLEVGDYVLTTSGFYGLVIDISNNDDNMVIVEFGNNKNCRIPMDKSAINKVEKPNGN